MLINAERAYKDGKYSQSQSLYSQILNEDPDNATAILYEGLSIGWQGNLVRYTMGIAGDATDRALDIAYKQMHDGSEYEIFALKVVAEITNLGGALSKLCEKNINEALNTYKKELDDMRREMDDIWAPDLDYYKRRQESYKDRFDKNVDRYAKINDNTLLIVLSVYEKIVNSLINVNEYQLKSYTLIKQAILAIKKRANYDITVSKADDLDSKVSKCIDEKEKVENEKKYKTKLKLREK